MMMYTHNLKLLEVKRAQTVIYSYMYFILFISMTYI